jgi:hypothetical protein
MPLGKRLIMAVGLFILIAAFVTVMFALWSNPTSNIRPLSPQYVKLRNGNDTRIFLVSAIPSYGGYAFADAKVYPGPGSPEIHRGDPCVIINVTVRNDYDAINPLPPYLSIGHPNSTRAEVSLSAQLYDRDNRIIEAMDVTPPLPRVPAELNSPISSMKSGETLSYNMYLSTGNRNVETFTIVAAYVGAEPPP